MNDQTAVPVLVRSTADEVVTLTLNRPRQYNALSGALLAALHEELDAIARDESVRGPDDHRQRQRVLLRPRPEEMRAMQSPKEVEELFFACSEMMKKLVRLPQPVIAVVNGLATAAGCQLVAQCDLAVAASNARFAASGINLGLFCSTPAVSISRNLGRKRAAEMLFTGEFVDAETALEWGLLNRVAPPEQLQETARALADTLRSKPREALALGKALFYRQLEERLGAAYDDASRTIAANMDTDLAREGVDAFFDKRSPRWKA
jgi:enoyl-CoA hydratase/carnithine racemase